MSKYSLLNPRSGFGAVSIANDLYIIGGNDGKPSNTMEILSNGY